MNDRPPTPNRRTTPHSYYEIFVYPNFEDYLGNPDDIRRGFNACVPAFQLADVMFEYYSINDPSKLSQWREPVYLHKYLEKIQPAFLTIQSIATAYKHLHPRGSFNEIGSPMALWALTLPSDGLALNIAWDGKPDVIVRRKNAPHVSLTGALTAVVEGLWPSVLPKEN